jgi:glutathione peroxidase
MQKPICLLSVAVALAASSLLFAEPPSTQPSSSVPPVLNFTMKRLDGGDQPLSKYAGKVLLMVNTASKCGFTKQYEALEALNKKYASQGLAVLGFPSNDFKNQEPGTDQQIAEFCKATYGVSFDMFSKVDVKGDTQAPLYALLTSKAPETGEVKWNFEKFLIGRDGSIVARFRSAVTPDNPAMVKAIEAELAKPAPEASR